jgi:polysaccharide biosynthesis protein PslH
VADMGEMLSESSIVLVPLKGGGGTRLKILEAFGAGRAVVSTRLGAEGIRAEHGRHLLIADTPEEIADAVAGLLADPARRQELAAAARRLAEERYGWAAIGAGMADDLEALVTGGPSPGVAAATGAQPRSAA